MINETRLDNLERKLDLLVNKVIGEEDVTKRRDKIYAVLPIGKPKTVTEGQIIEEVVGTPGWLQQEFGLTKSQVRKDLDHLLENGVSRVPVKLNKEGVSNKVNTFQYYKELKVKKVSKRSVYSEYVNVFGSSQQLLKIVDIIIKMLPHKNPVTHNLKKDGKQNILRQVNWTLETDYSKDPVYHLVDSLVSVEILKRTPSIKERENYFFFYNNSEFNRDLYTKNQMLNILKERMG